MPNKDRMKKPLKILALSLALIPGAARAQSSTPDLTVATDNQVYAVTTLNGVTYFGGDFTRVGDRNTGQAAVIDIASGLPDTGFPKPNGDVFAVISDGANGWYIGGDFSSVGSVTRSRLAHILSDNSVDPAFDPGPDGTVRTLLLSGTTLYVGGEFFNIGLQARNRIASLDTTTGLANAFDPNASGTVFALLLNGTTLYVGGDFSSDGPSIGGQARNYLAALDTLTDTNQASAWAPSANNTVRALALSGTTLYAGGDFSGIGGAARNRIAALDTTVDTDQATPWDPSADDTVKALALSGSTLYVGGGFGIVGGQNRHRLAAINTATGLATSWDPNIRGNAGNDRNTGPLPDHCPNAGSTFPSDNVSDDVNAIAVSADGTVYVGGGFGALDPNCTTLRNRLAAINATTGLPTSWNPSADDTVNALAISGSEVLAGGVFTNLGGVYRRHLAAVDSSGIITSWNPNSTGSCNNRGSNNDGAIRAMAAGNGLIYVGGCFDTVGGQSRNNLAALDPTTGNAAAWKPEPDGRVRALAVSGSLVYVGGAFNLIGQTNQLTRHHVAAIDATTGNATSWDPNPRRGANRSLRCPNPTRPPDGNDGTRRSDGVTAIVPNGSVIYVGGFFRQIGAGCFDRRGLAAIDAATGIPTAWNPSPDGYVFSLALSGNLLYVGGNFGFIGGLQRHRLAALLTDSTGYVTAWDPEAYGTGNNDRGAPGCPDATSNDGKYGGGDVPVSLFANGSLVFAGGGFSFIGAGCTNRVGFAALDATTGLASSFSPILSGFSGFSRRFYATDNNNGIRAMASDGSHLIAVGAFDNMGGATVKGGLARFQIPTALSAGSGGSLSFNPALGLVITVKIPAGAFTGGVNLTVGAPADLPSASSTEGTALTGTGVGVDVTGNGGLQPSKPVSITMCYRSFDIRGFDERKLVIARLDADRTLWVPYATSVNSAGHCANASVDHLSTFQLMGAAGGSVDTIRAWPNPLRPAKGQAAMTFAGAPAEARIRIYTLQGELVRDLTADAAGMTSWDGTNQNGQKVGSGVYYALITSGGNKKTFKVAVQR